MQHKITILFLFLFLISQKTMAHTEEVGQLKIDNFENQLFVTATLDKRALSYALMNEGDCSPKDMLSECGNDYFLSHVTIKVNGVLVSLGEISMILEKASVTFQYQLDGVFDNIQSIEVESDYMLQYAEHARLRVFLDVADFQKNYSMDQNRKKINIQTNLLL